MEDQTQKARMRAWSAYWSTGRLHSCAGGSGDNYVGAIGEFWTAWCAEIGQGVRILDLATGNGPLPMLIADALGQEVNIDAVDQAALSPEWNKRGSYPNVSFRPGVRMEDLPFGADAFDWIISQFGFEYSDMEVTLGECIRVAKWNAGLVFVMHHADSVLVRVGREELSHQQRLLADDGLIAVAGAIIPWVAKSRLGFPAVGVPEAEAARMAYNEAMMRLERTAIASEAPDLLHDARQYIHGLVAHANLGDAVSRLALLEDYASLLRDAKLRTTELIAHALTETQVQEIVDVLRALRPNLKIETRALRQDEGVVAWSLMATPSVM